MNLGKVPHRLWRRRCIAPDDAMSFGADQCEAGRVPFLDRSQGCAPFLFDKAAGAYETNEAFRRASPQNNDGTIVDP